MARKNREKKERLSPEQKRELRRKKRALRKAMRDESGLPEPIRQEREKTDEQEAQFWTGIKARGRAAKLLSEATNWQRPWWLSIKYEGGIPPSCWYYPCTMFRRGNRWHYGFLFRDQRDGLFKTWSQKHPEYKIRKELTS